MGTIYLTNILHIILIYSIYISFIITIIFEYIFNMIVCIHSKYTLINPNTPNYIIWNSQNTPLYTHRVATKLVTFATNGA